MSELSQILENFKIRERLTRLKYENKVPLFHNIFCISKGDLEEQQIKIKELAEKAAKELEQIAKEKTEAINNYYKELDRKIEKMSDRQLLEEIVRRGV